MPRTPAAFIEIVWSSVDRHVELLGRQRVGEALGTAITASRISGRARVRTFWPALTTCPGSA